MLFCEQVIGCIRTTNIEHMDPAITTMIESFVSEYGIVNCHTFRNSLKYAMQCEDSRVNCFNANDQLANKNLTAHVYPPAMFVF